MYQNLFMIFICKSNIKIVILIHYSRLWWIYKFENKLKTKRYNIKIDLLYWLNFNYLYAIQIHRISINSIIFKTIINWNSIYFMIMSSFWYEIESNYLRLFILVSRLRIKLKFEFKLKLTLSICINVEKRTLILNLLRINNYLMSIWSISLYIIDGIWTCNSIIWLMYNTATVW